MERDEEMKKSWAKVGEDVGLVVVDHDDVEQEEEDREVERILVKGKEAKRKLATGMYRFNVKLIKKHCSVQYSTYKNQLYHVKQLTLPFSCENCGSRAQDDCRGMGDVQGGGGGSRDW